MREEAENTITREDSHFLLQGISPTKGLSLVLLHCRWILYHLSLQGSPENTISIDALLSDMEEFVRK